ESSYMIDVEAIAKRCREVGATLVLDVFQSAGIVPVDVTGWDVPVAVGGVLKWLCGGPGGSFLYVDPKLRPKLEPSFTGWMAHAKEVAFELNAEDIVCDFRPGAGVRFSPHFYTTDEEIEIAFATADEILRKDRWKRQAAKQAIVT